MASRHSHTALPRWATERRLVVFSKAKRGTAVPTRDRCRARQQNEGWLFSPRQREERPSQHGTSRTEPDFIQSKQSTPAEFFRWRSYLFPGKHNRHGFSAAIGQDCSPALARGGPPHLEQQSSQRIEPGRVLGAASRWSRVGTAKRCSRTGVSHRLHCRCPARQRNMTPQALGLKLRENSCIIRKDSMSVGWEV